MKKKTTAALVLPLLAVLFLSGCAMDHRTKMAELKEVAEAREYCHSLDGVFTVTQDDMGTYYWSCDLSDRKD